MQHLRLLPVPRSLSHMSLICTPDSSSRTLTQLQLHHVSKDCSLIPSHSSALLLFLTHCPDCSASCIFRVVSMYLPSFTFHKIYKLFPARLPRRFISQLTANQLPINGPLPHLNSPKRLAHPRRFMPEARLASILMRGFACGLRCPLSLSPHSRLLSFHSGYFHCLPCC